MWWLATGLVAVASWASDLSDSSEKGTPLVRESPPPDKDLKLGSTSAVSKVFSRFVGKLKIRVKAKLDETI